MPIHFLIPERQTLSRRQWIVRVLEAAGAAPFASQLIAQEHAGHDQPSFAQANKPWHPAVLTPDQNDTLVTLGECIIPGSTSAGCNRIIDLILTLESEKTRKETVDALASFDAAANTAYGGPFREILPPQQHQILVAAASDDGALSPQFRLIKEWVADTYWSSEEGMRELGWNGRLAWAKFDGCSHEEKHS